MNTLTILRKTAALSTVLVLAAACTQHQPTRDTNTAALAPEKIARQKLVDLFAAHADRFDCQSFRYADHTLTATNVHIAPDPSIAADHPSATLAIKKLVLTLAEDPTPAHDLRLLSLEADEPALLRPASLRTSSEPTETEAFLATYVTDLLDKMSNPHWTTLMRLAPMATSTTDHSSAAGDALTREFADLRSVDIRTFRIEMPPDSAGNAPNALVLNAHFTRADDGHWQTLVQAGTQIADNPPDLAPPLHVDFQLQDAHLLARSPDPAPIPDNATALDR